MEDTTPIVQAMASPLAAHSEAFSELVAKKLFENVRARVLSQLTERSSALATALADLDSDTSHYWRPELGAMTAACNAGNAELAALQLITMHPRGALSAQLNIGKAGHLYMDGNILPLQGRVEVRLQADRLQLAREHDALFFCMSRGRWTLEDTPPDSVWRVHGLRAAHPRYVIESTITNPESVFPVIGKYAFRKDAKPADAATVTACLDVLRSTLQYIETYSKTYESWFRGSIDGLVLTTGSSATSMTSPLFPGLVALNMGYDALDYAEVLTSAASQQKLHQLSLVSSLTLPGKEEVRYLPTRRSYTTSRRALTSAHDHVNAIRMLSDLSLIEGLSDQVASRIETRKLLLATDCMPILESSEILTPAGQELWRCLKDAA
jgi:HEXXH motif-containing protein